MIEVIIALFVTVVAVLGVFSLVSPAWRTSTRSDCLGRASGILYEELIRQEARIMNPCCNVTAGTLPAVAVNTSGQTTSQSGDMQFNVATTISSLGTNFWAVTVRVTWPGHTGISESLVVSRQDSFGYPSVCPNGQGGTACQ